MSCNDPKNLQKTAVCARHTAVLLVYFGCQIDHPVLIALGRGYVEAFPVGIEFFRPGVDGEVEIIQVFHHGGVLPTIVRMVDVDLAQVVLIVIKVAPDHAAHGDRDQLFAEVQETTRSQNSILHFTRRRDDDEVFNFAQVFIVQVENIDIIKVVAEDHRITDLLAAGGSAGNSYAQVAPEAGPLVVPVLIVEVRLIVPIPDREVGQFV